MPCDDDDDDDGGGGDEYTNLYNLYFALLSIPHFSPSLSHYTSSPLQPLRSGSTPTGWDGMNKVTAIGFWVSM
jgi:hypothetical protein